MNSEYGYYLRDQSGDGVPDKDNSTSLDVDAARHVGHRHGRRLRRDRLWHDVFRRQPRSRAVRSGCAERTTPGRRRSASCGGVFTGLEWWKLEPHDDLLKCSTARAGDGKQLERLAPPDSTYWALAQPGKQYVVYVRVSRWPVSIALENAGALRARQFDPRTGATIDLPRPAAAGAYSYRPPDRQDWVVVLTENDQ